MADNPGVVRTMMDGQRALVVCFKSLEDRTIVPPEQAGFAIARLEDGTEIFLFPSEPEQEEQP